jgi:hypothetical protein
MVAWPSAVRLPVADAAPPTPKPGEPVTMTEVLEQAKQFFMARLAGQDWVPVEQVWDAIPDDLARAALPLLEPLDLPDADEMEVSRHYLTRLVLDDLEKAAWCERRSGPAGEEFRSMRKVPDAGPIPDQEAAADGHMPKSDELPPAESAEASAVALAPAIPAPVEVSADDLVIDPEFAGLGRALDGEEDAQLEQNLLRAQRCRDPLTAWKVDGLLILLDGHNRHRINRKHNLPFTVVAIELPDREAARNWIIDNQLGRRNLTPEQASYLRGLRYIAAKQSHGGRRRGTPSSGHGAPLKTDEALAQQYGVDPRTIRRDGQFAANVDAIAANCGDGAKRVLLSPTSKLSRQAIQELARKAPEEQQRAVHEAAKPSAPTKPRPAKPAKTMLRVPVEPQALAATLVRELGYERAAKVHEALGGVLAQQQTGPVSKASTSRQARMQKPKG